MDEHISHMAAADLAAPRGGTAASQTPAQGQDNLNFPASNNRAPARLAASPRHSEYVAIAWEPGSRDSLMAWVVYPVTSNASTPVVVVVHEIFGLSNWVRGVADQVAADGFIAIAPDLVSRARGGHSTVTLPDTTASRLIRGVTIDERNKGIVAAANYAMALPSAAQRYAIIGYCWGGTTVWAHSIYGGTKGFAGGVAFYGGFPYMSGTPAAPVADSMARIKTPVMLLNGSRDARIGATMPAIDSLMKAMTKDYVGVNYEGAIHGFLRAQDDSAFVRDSTAPGGRRRDTAAEQANLVATKDGWPRTVAFLKKQLGMK